MNKSIKFRAGKQGTVENHGHVNFWESLKSIGNILSHPRHECSGILVVQVTHYIAGNVVREDVERHGGIIQRNGMGGGIRVKPREVSHMKVRTIKGEQLWHRDG